MYRSWNLDIKSTMKLLWKVRNKTIIFPIHFPNFSQGNP